VIELSLILCTRDRCGSLAACLDHLRRVDTPPDRWELIVVDNGSRDGTPELIEKYASDARFRVTSISEPRPGQGRARNAGLASAVGDVVAFTDDDCYVSNDFINNILQIFSAHDIACIGGRILLHDPSDARMTIREEAETVILEPYSFVRPGFINGANMAARRDVLVELGGFDVMVGPGTPFICDDVDFVARASWAGYRIGYFPGPLVYHHHRRKPGRDADSLRRRYERGIGAYHAKFMMSRVSRKVYMKHWCRAIGYRILRNYYLSTAAWEMIGALHYTLCAVANRMSGWGRSPVYGRRETGNEYG